MRRKSLVTSPSAPLMALASGGSLICRLMNQVATNSNATMKRPPITAAMPRRRTARRRSSARKMLPTIAASPMMKAAPVIWPIVPSASHRPRSSTLLVTSLRLLSRPLAPCWFPPPPPPDAWRLLVMRANEAPRSRPRRPPPPRMIALCVWRTALRKIDLNVSVSITPARASSKAGRKLVACWLPAWTSCSVSRWESSRRTASELSGSTARALNESLS